jgi:RNA polymerase primary sigma factor
MDLLSLALQSPAVLDVLVNLRAGLTRGKVKAEALVRAQPEAANESAEARFVAWQRGVAQHQAQASPHWRHLDLASRTTTDPDEDKAAVVQLEENRLSARFTLGTLAPSDALYERVTGAMRNWLAATKGEDSLEGTCAAHLGQQFRIAELEIRALQSRCIAANQGLVQFAIKRYARLGMGLPDLLQEGNIGLMRAVEKFDVERGIRFNTYAVWWIRQAARRALSNQSRTIRLPVHLLDKKHTVDRAAAKLSQRLGRFPSLEELEQETEIPPQALDRLLRVTKEPLSLEAGRGAEGETRLLDLIPDDNSTVPDDSTNAAERHTQITELLSELTPREQEVLRMRFGLEGGEARTLEQVGQALGVTRERARQIVSAGLSKLRRVAAWKNVDISAMI